ncbi:Proteolipid protein 2 [Caenorhabditis elegans]|uniref:Proteolipid protein 2 n=1 Tax=Caenorhabditis elegans TaxID=6239 RepID=H2KZY9_CAEEL|nr:Proteolipid protein 2 [Caenorhabditis elegans]CCD70586.1 Proteolipid protein 2 [Caenorhabditis elegans]|eukprot:NP_001255255.1 Uncharacterized protein CELE_W02C12.2 [Caenorhabditis elegans]
MLLCCCWPLGKCAKVLACFDTLIVAIFAYKSFIILMETMNHNLHWTTVIAFLFFSMFLICEILGTIFIILAAQKKIARYCIPRLGGVGEHVPVPCLRVFL